MDLYLKDNTSYQRLENEYKKYGSLIIAVDFDDTLYDFHKQGIGFELMIKLIQDLREIGCYIIIWTGNQNTEFVESYLQENKIPYDSINDEAPISKKLLKGNFPRKVYANAYLDDRAGLKQVYEELTLLIKNIRK